MPEKKVWCTSICANRECPKRINHAAHWSGPCEYAAMKGTEDCPMREPGKEHKRHKGESEVRMDV